MSTATVTLGSRTVPLRSAIAEKSGNEYWVLCPKSKKPGAAVRFGTKIPAQAESLPLVILMSYGAQTIVVPLERGLNMGGKPKVSGSATVEVADLDGARKIFQVSISELEPGIWNMKCSIRGASGGGGARVADLDDFGSGLDEL